VLCFEVVVGSNVFGRKEKVDWGKGWKEGKGVGGERDDVTVF
jgi:hypothetical protein